MGTDIDGWIEYRNIDLDDETWYPAMKIGVVYLGRDYETFGYLFGIRILDVQPIAARRGLPANVSPQVREDAAYGNLYAHTWITWHEMKQGSWKRDVYWDPTIRVLEVLGGLYGDENIRLVVWFED
ncbi:hypothetical protein ccbrp13_25720 [Ktedonobacteria bacterium brp13]|nr:hypothetical protein ccbrp13_25720 [Ktedonobacteria bacterium brp13]